MKLRLALLALTLMACSEITGSCDEDRRTLDAIYDEFYDVTLSLVQTYRSQGYDCDSEPLYNAFGNRIGTRYVCTRCE